MKTALRTLTGLTTALCLSAVVMSSAHAESSDLEARVNRIESQTLVDFLTRLDRMQSDLQQLRGQIEEQTHTMDGMQQRQKDMYLELDARLRKLEQGGAATPPAADGGDNAATPPAVSDNGSTPPPVAAAGNGADTAQAAYQQAFDLLKNGKYPQAIRSFHDFLGRYPDNALADNAQYWTAEASYVTRDYPAALTDFRKVIDRYPSSSKVPDAMLKIGFIYYQQNNWGKARDALNQVKIRYPASSAARLADERLRKMKQEGH